MKFFRTNTLILLALLLSFGSFGLHAIAQDTGFQHPKTYTPNFMELQKYKNCYDDPRPYLNAFGPKQVLPSKMYANLSYDIEKMKDLWSEVVGFRSTDLVGKIAPEIKPGKYTYKDKAKYPGLKKLMWQDLYDRIKQGEPPHGGCIPEFEVVPTRQYYYALPVAEATKRNMGKTKLDQKGYIVNESWQGGYPFPRPSGTAKAQKIMYNVEKRYVAWGQNFILLGWYHGYTKRLAKDFDGTYTVSQIRLSGRCVSPPFGWYDDRAKLRGEYRTFLVGFPSPRDVAGTAQAGVYYLDTGKSDQLMLYIPSLRRIRKMSATDSQDPIMGQDLIYDDNDGFLQKLSPTRYPYKYELIEEREFLIPAPTRDGSEYFDSEKLECHGLKFERRPMYVVQLTQLDPNYVYSKRIFYIDKETFKFVHVENYDQKGRLYRTWDSNYSFCPEMGAFSWSGALMVYRDHLDLHTTVSQPYQLPAFYTRSDLSLMGLLRRAK